MAEPCAADNGGQSRRACSRLAAVYPASAASSVREILRGVAKSFIEVSCINVSLLKGNCWKIQCKFVSFLLSYLLLFHHCRIWFTSDKSVMCLPLFVGFYVTLWVGLFSKLWITFSYTVAKVLFINFSDLNFRSQEELCKKSWTNCCEIFGMSVSGMIR